MGGRDCMDCNFKWDHLNRTTKKYSSLRRKLKLLLCLRLSNDIAKKRKNTKAFLLAALPLFSIDKHR